ncbi:hypothetical protein TNIN_300411 [Trichonephila inaurata madagascariensis]|uniref:Uncharacterized protein n=1 Tax=Trichonephila inaurata madagascariensis TaxID=2747483 RepID=A0A8X6YG28_9ARAC|nr:hypothetical protein TNIN_300411 [Trichonephila inaurata madagascariensis]
MFQWEEVSTLKVITTKIRFLLFDFYELWISQRLSGSEPFFSISPFRADKRDQHPFLLSFNIFFRILLLFATMDLTFDNLLDMEPRTPTSPSTPTPKKICSRLQQLIK